MSHPVDDDFNLSLRVCLLSFVLLISMEHSLDYWT